MRPDIVPGSVFPDYELPDHTGAVHRLSELQDGDPMCLILSRGGYCPKDHHQHLQMVRMQTEIRIGYSKIVTISTDGFLATLEWRDRLEANWTFLCDPERRVQKDLDIQEYTDPLHDPMVPHTVMLEPGLVVYKIYMGYWYWLRPTPEEIRQDFRAITRKIRPDADLSTPGLRERWEAGDKAIFWPYGKKRIAGVPWLEKE